MAQWKRWSMSRKVLFLTVVLAVVALTAWAANHHHAPMATATAVDTTADTTAATAEPTKAESLDAAMPPRPRS